MTRRETAGFLLQSLFAITLFALAACSQVNAACKVIDAAEAACAIIEYKDPATGEKKSVRVSREDLVGVAKLAELRKVTVLGDGGAP